LGIKPIEAKAADLAWGERLSMGEFIFEFKALFKDSLEEKGER
jgi:hypothetical protein